MFIESVRVVVFDCGARLFESLHCNQVSNNQIFYVPLPYTCTDTLSYTHAQHSHVHTCMHIHTITHTCTTLTRAHTHAHTQCHTLTHRRMLTHRHNVTHLPFSGSYSVVCPRTLMIVVVSHLPVTLEKRAPFIMVCPGGFYSKWYVLGGSVHNGTSWGAPFIMGRPRGLHS